MRGAAEEMPLRSLLGKTLDSKSPMRLNVLKLPTLLLAVALVLAPGMIVGPWIGHDGAARAADAEPACPANQVAGPPEADAPRANPSPVSRHELANILCTPAFHDLPFDIKDIKIEKGDTFKERLIKSGLSPEIAAQIIKLAKPYFNFGRIKANQKFKLWLNANNEFERIVYPINEVDRLVISKDFKVTRERLELGNLQSLLMKAMPTPAWTDSTKGYNYYRGAIVNNFLDSAKDAGMSREQAIVMTKIFGHAVFNRLHPGDRFSIVTEMGESPLEEGKIVAAMIEVKGKPQYMFLYEEKDKSGYYNHLGQIVEKRKFITPIRYKRISSIFTYRRFHPILGSYRPHLGVDFAASSGTPIVASADGVVQTMGYNGGFGNSVTLKHLASDFSSMYNHLSGYAKGIKKGGKIKQGQVIGYCGSTGLSTGPHLDYRVFKADKAVDPLKVTSLGGLPLRDIKKFEEFKKLMKAELGRDLPYGPPKPYFNPNKAKTKTAVPENTEQLEY